MLRADKALKDFAKRLTQISLDESGQVSEEKVGAVLEALRTKPPHKLKTMLKLYLYYIQREIRKSEAVVEHAGAVDPETLDDLQRYFSEHYGRAVTVRTQPSPDLIAGIRASIGDDVYDSSIIGNLDVLASSVK